MSKSTFLFHLVYKQIVIESPFLNNEFSIRNVFLWNVGTGTELGGTPSIFTYFDYV